MKKILKLARPVFMHKNRQYVCPQHRNAFTLIELLVVIAIISLLVSILLPSLNKARDLAKQVVCASNEKNMGPAVTMYANDFDDWLPAHAATAGSVSGYWNRLLVTSGYIDTPIAPDTGLDYALSPYPGSLFSCPAETSPTPHWDYDYWTQTHYGMNCYASYGSSRFRIDQIPSDYYYIGDSGGWGWAPTTLGPTVSSTVIARHLDGWNAMFIDGRVEFQSDHPLDLVDLPADGEAPWNIPGVPQCLDGATIPF